MTDQERTDLETHMVQRGSDAALILIVQSLDEVKDSLRDAAVKRDEADKHIKGLSDDVKDLKERMSAVEQELDHGLIEWVQKHWQKLVFTSPILLALFSALTLGGATLFWRNYGDGIARFFISEIRRIEQKGVVLVQPAGLSYVREPVYVGDPVLYILYAGRTDWGAANCIYEGFVASFSDESGNSASWKLDGPKRQIGKTLKGLQIQLQVPPEIQPGRVLMRGQISYLCNDQKVFENTNPVSFDLRPKV